MGILGGLGGIIGGMDGAKRDRRFKHGAMEAQQRAILAMLTMQGQGAGLSEEYFQKALGQLNSVGPAMRQGMLASGKQAQAGATASSLGSGLTGTTAHSGFLRGVTADTNQNLAGLEQNLAGARSSMFQNRGAELYQQMIDRANIRQRTEYDPFLSNWSPSGHKSGAAGGAGIGGFLSDLGGAFGLGKGDGFLSKLF